jgi:PAS domain S-box-containing protein
VARTIRRVEARMSSVRGRPSRNLAKLNPLLRTAILAFLVLTLCYLSAKLAGVLIMNIPQTVWPLWPGCAVLVAVLLLAPRKIWPILLPAGLAGFVLYDLQAGVPISSIAWLLLADTLEVLVAAWGVSYALNGQPRLNSLKALAKYSFFTVFLASLIVASIGTKALGGDDSLNWRFSFLSEALAFLTVTPAILGLFGQGRPLLRASRAYYLEAGILIATVSSLSYFMFVAYGRSDSPALLYSLVPFLIWSALRFGSAGVGTSATMVALMSVWGAVHGRGPFTETDPINRVLYLQLFLLFTSIPFMVLAVLVEERKSAQDELRKSEERLRSAMESGKAVGWEWDLKTGRDSWFGDLKTMFGIPAETYVGRPEDFHRYVHPDDRQHVAEAVADSRNNHRPYAAEFRVVWPNGNLRWAAATGQFQYSPNGEPEHMFGMAVDITDRKQAEDAVWQSEEKYRRIVETTNEGIWLLDSNFHTSFVNRQMAGMLGYQPGEMLGRSVFDFYFPEDVERKRQGLLRRRQMLSEHLDDRLRRRDGAELWVRMAAMPICKDSGDFDGSLAMVSDITDRKRAEEALRESEERFRLVANTAPMLIWMSDAQRLCTYFNHSWLAFTGRPMELELGNGWAEGVHAEDLQGCLGTYTRAFDTREKFRMEYRLRRHDGEYRWVLDIGVPRFNPDGSFAGFIGSCVDVTERKLAEEALSGVNSRLIEAQERERTRIARELHDDIGQRLAILTIELEQFGQKFSDLPAELLQRIGELRGISSEIATDVQSLSHELHSSKLEYLGLATALMAFCHEFSEQQNVEVVFAHDEVPRTLPREISLCLFRVSQEALQNAIKHSGVRHFEVELHYASDMIQLTVRDSGSGFDREDALKTHGLGLISMAERVKLLGGQLSIDSQPQHGTTIRANVPLSKAARASA